MNTATRQASLILITLGIASSPTAWAQAEDSVLVSYGSPDAPPRPGRARRP